MGNMSYCRFRNTLNDLRDCQETLDNRERLSKKYDREEWSAREKLIKLCREIADNYDELDFPEKGEDEEDDEDEN